MTIITTTKEMRPRDPNDHYPTPIPTVEAALALLPPTFRPVDILDPGAGDGVWGRVACRRWRSAELHGVELRDVEQNGAYDLWYKNTDFRLLNRSCQYDLVIGNPPYKHAEEFVRLSLQCLDADGYLLFLLRLAFLEGQERGRDLWRRLPPKAVHVCSARPSFTQDKRTDATAYGVFCWQKGWQGETQLGWVA